MITIDQLVRATGAKYLTAAVWAGPLAAAMGRFEINTPARVACFLAQIGHESGGLARLRESLNYTPDALMRTWPSRFSRELAEKHGRTKEHPANERMIAEIAYGGRMGNGPTGSGDGARFIGRGPIQITGADNYIRIGHVLGRDFLSQPSLLESPPDGAMSAAWFWASGNRTGRSLNKLADEWNVRDISDVINGTTAGRAHGLAERIALTQRGRELFA